MVTKQYSGKYHCWHCYVVSARPKNSDPFVERGGNSGGFQCVNRIDGSHENYNARMSMQWALQSFSLDVNGTRFMYMGEYYTPKYVGFDFPIVLEYRVAAPATLKNGMIWMEVDGLHIYYNGAEKVVAGV